MPPADHDADDLVVRAALGEPLTEDEQAWLDEDPALQERVAEFVEIVDLARSAPDEVASDEQIDHLWAGIAAEAFGPREAFGPSEGAADEVRAPDPAPADPGPDVAPVVSIRSRRVRWVGLAAAAAAVVVALVAVGPFGSPPPRPLAAADLRPVGEVEVAPVAAEFVAAGSHTELRVDLSALPDQQDAFYEVWLLDLDEGRLLSLGPLRPDGTYALPDGTEVGDFPTVDVSVEPHDGDPTHSGSSVLRGPVQA